MDEIKGTITAGGSAQRLFKASGSRRGFAIQNNSSGELTVGFENAPNVDGPLKVPAGAFFSAPESFPLGGEVRIWGATTGQKFSAWSY